MLYNCEKLSHEEIKDLLQMEIAYKKNRNEKILRFLKFIIILTLVIYAICLLVSGIGSIFLSLASVRYAY